MAKMPLSHQGSKIAAERIDAIRAGLRGKLKPTAVRERAVALVELLAGDLAAFPAVLDYFRSGSFDPELRRRIDATAVFAENLVGEEAKKRHAGDASVGRLIQESTR